MTMRARDAILSILASRAATTTICPSEVARAISGGRAWRDYMPVVHIAIDGLLAEGAVRLTWKGQSLATRTGPYRIGRGSSS